MQIISINLYTNTNNNGIIQNTHETIVILWFSEYKIKNIELEIITLEI